MPRMLKPLHHDIPDPQRPKGGFRGGVIKPKAKTKPPLGFLDWQMAPPFPRFSDIRRIEKQIFGGFVIHGDVYNTAPKVNLEKPKPPVTLQTWSSLRELRTLITDLSEGKYAARSRFNGPDKYDIEKLTGMTRLGAGNFSSVWEMGVGSNSRVIKITSHRNGDPGYERFVQFAQKNRDNPNLPKIIYKATWGKWRVYIMERLEADYLKQHHFVEALRVSQDGNPLIAITCDQLKALFQLLDEHDFANDLHKDNVMLRGDTFVVTDPCTY